MASDAAKSNNFTSTLLAKLSCYYMLRKKAESQLTHQKPSRQLWQLLPARS